MQIVFVQCVFHALRRLVKAARKTKEIGSSNLSSIEQRLTNSYSSLCFSLALALICISVCCLPATLSPVVYLQRGFECQGDSPEDLFIGLGLYSPCCRYHGEIYGATLPTGKRRCYDV